LGRFREVQANIWRAYQAGRETARAAAREEREHEGRQHGGRDPEVTEIEASAAETPLEHPVGKDGQDVPYPLRIAAAWSWRLLIVAAAAAVLLYVVGMLKQVVVPVAISLLLSALLAPLVGFLRQRAGLHRSLATAITMIGGLAVVAGVLTLVVSEFVNSWGELSQQAQGGIQQIQDWLKGGPLHLSDKQLTSGLDAAQDWLKGHKSVLTSGAVSTATTAFEVVASTLLILFTTFFFLRDGRRIWRFLVGLLPAAAREPLGSAGEQSWQTLVAYVRATVLVAFIDATGIGIGLVVLRVDLAFALAALVFLGAFIPIVGATLSGTVAVLVALVTRNPVTALVVVIVVIAVQQVEGHVLQPFIMGRAVAVHPLAVIIAIATGVVLAGIIGALVAVPILAVLNTGVRHIAARRRHEPDPPPPADVVVRG
jgi:predicted PurR-regulated permease PerM